MPSSIRTHTAALVVALAALGLCPAAGQAAAKTEMLRVFSKDVSLTLTRPCRYQGASGRLIEDKEVNGGSDVVVRIRLRGSARSARAAEPAWDRALRIRGEAMNRLW